MWVQRGAPPVGGRRENAGAERTAARAFPTTHTRPFTVSRYFSLFNQLSISPAKSWNIVRTYSDPIFIVATSQNVKPSTIDPLFSWVH